MTAVLVAGLALGTAVWMDAGQAVKSQGPWKRLFQGRELEWPSKAWTSGAVVSPPTELKRTQSGKLSVGLDFAGLSSADTSGDPPDPVIGVGSGFVVQMVNTAVRIWTADGVVRADYPLASFFAASSPDVSDPSIVFDPADERWFAPVVDVAGEAVRVAVSSGSDPTGPWRVYSHASGSCPDQPSLGISGNFVVLGYSAFALPCRADSPRYLGGALFVYEKQQLLDGSEARAVDWGPRPDLSPVAAVSLTRGPAIAVALVSPPLAGGPTYLAVLTMPGPTITRLPITSLTPPPRAAQAGTSLPIETNDVRIISAVADQRTLWLAGNEGCVPRGDRQPRSCLRIIAVTKGQISLDTDVGAKGRDLFYPALAPTVDGEVVVVHGFSSRGAYPGLSAFAIAPGNHRTPSVAIAEGTAPTLSTRFGDYFGAAAGSHGRVWVTGESTVGPASLRWGTTVASLTAKRAR